METDILPFPETKQTASEAGAEAAARYLNSHHLATVETPDDESLLRRNPEQIFFLALTGGFLMGWLAVLALPHCRRQA